MVFKVKGGGFNSQSLPEVVSKAPRGGCQNGAFPWDGFEKYNPTKIRPLMGMFGQTFPGCGYGTYILFYQILS